MEASRVEPEGCAAVINIGCPDTPLRTDPFPYDIQAGAATGTSTNPQQCIWDEAMRATAENSIL